jgi:ABC-type branched-subunit amino acid transport system substrate-binding protein
MTSQVTGHRRLAAMAAAAVAATTLVAACSSSSQGGTSSSQAGASANSDVAASGSPVKIMATGILATPAANFVESVNGAEAAADAINKAGGINGHPIQVITCNDNLNAADAIGCAREAVADHVIAYAGGDEPFDSGVFPYLQSAGIPWVGPLQNSTTTETNSLSFPLEGESDVTSTESGKLAVEKGGKRVVIIQLSDAPASIFSATFMASGVQSVGGTVAKLIGAPIETVNWSSYAAQAMNADPDAVTCSCSPQNTPQLLQALRQAGYTGPLIEPSTEFLTAGIKSLGSAAGKVYLISTMRDPDVPFTGLTQYLDEMKATQPASALRDQTSELSWLSVHVIADLLHGQKSLTSATLLKQLQATNGINGHDLIPTGVNWSKPGPLAKYPRIPDSDVLIYQWENGKLVALNGQFVPAIG